MAVKAGDMKWVVATKSGSQRRFAHEVKVVRVMPGNPYDCEIEEPEEGYRSYAMQKNLFDSKAEAEKEAAKNGKPTFVLSGAVRIEAAQRLLATSSRPGVG